MKRKKNSRNVVVVRNVVVEVEVVVVGWENKRIVVGDGGGLVVKRKQ